MARDLHPPSGRTVLHDGEGELAWAQVADLLPYQVQVPAGQKFHLRAAGYPQQPVYGPGDRLVRREHVEVDHGSLGKRIPLVRVAAEVHGARQGLRLAARRQQIFLLAQVALELGDEVADCYGDPGGGHGLLPGGRACQQFCGSAQPHVIPGQPGCQ